MEFFEILLIFVLSIVFLLYSTWQKKQDMRLETKLKEAEENRKDERAAQDRLTRRAIAEMQNQRDLTSLALELQADQSNSTEKLIAHFLPVVLDSVKSGEIKLPGAAPGQTAAVPTYNNLGGADDVVSTAEAEILQVPAEDENAGTEQESLESRLSKILAGNPDIADKLAVYTDDEMSEMIKKYGKLL